MSKVKKNPAVENAQPDNFEPVAQPEEHNAPKTNGKHIGARCVAFLLMLLAVVSLFLPLLTVGEKEQSLLTSVLDFPKMTGIAANESLAVFAIYAFVVAIVATVLLSIFSICCAKHAVSRLCKAFGAFASGALLYTLSVFGAIDMDVISLALGAVGLLACIIVALKANGKKAGLPILQAILSIGAYALIALGLGKATALEMDITAVIGLALLAVSVFVGAIRIGCVRGIAVDFIRYVFTLAGAVILGVVFAGGNEGATSLRTFSIIAILIAVAQIIIAIIQLRYMSKADVEEAKEEFENSFEVEEYAEALPYEGGPVAGVQMAEEVNPTYTDTPAHVNTSGYDFYNCKSFDPFIAFLNTEERNQFTEIFILKFKGVMPELPDYEVGGDNKEFFRKVFIYLGQYRDRIPNGLLAKMYQYSLKIS